jgi:ATPase subunit of ABC transporter with duplicated ATPase domains
MNRTTWIQLERWYYSLHWTQQWLVKIGSALFIICCVIIVTHEPKERKKVSKIILDCYEGCGSNPERTISYNEYMDRKEQQQRTQFQEAKQQIQQQIWDERGRQRWCRNHPQDRNCQ